MVQLDTTMTLIAYATYEARISSSMLWGMVWLALAMRLWSLRSLSRALSGRRPSVGGGAVRGRQRTTMLLCSHARVHAYARMRVRARGGANQVGGEPPETRRIG